MKFIFASSLLIVSVFADEKTWEKLCGKKPQRKLKNDWKKLSRNIKKPSSPSFWSDDNFDQLEKRTKYVTEIIPSIFNDVLASIDDKFGDSMKRQNPDYEVLDNEFENVKAEKKVVKCKTYLNLLFEKVKATDKLLNPKSTAFKKAKKGVNISDWHKIRFLKVKTFNDVAQDHWITYNQKLTAIQEATGCTVKTNGAVGSEFQRIDKNDIKRVKWGLTKFQKYPKDENGKAIMNDQDFRRHIRKAANYFMCVSHVILEEAPVDAEYEDIHILFTFGNDFMPNELLKTVEKGNTRMGVNTPTCVHSNFTYPIEDDLSKSPEWSEPNRDFPYIRQKDMIVTSKGLTSGGESSGICGMNIYIADVMSMSDLILNGKGIEIKNPKLLPRWGVQKDEKGYNRIIIENSFILDCDPDLTFILTHELGHALGLSHGGSGLNQLMHPVPTRANVGVFQDFLNSKQMSFQKCKEFKEGKKVSVGDLFIGKTLFLENIKTAKTVRNNNDKRIQHISQNCKQANPCECGYDGLTNCAANFQKPVIPIVLRSVLENIRGENEVNTATTLSDTDSASTTAAVSTEKPLVTDSDITTPIATTTIENFARAPDGMTCTVTIHGLKAKKRLISTSLPDLYFKMKINGREVKNSKNKLKPNRVHAEWDFKLPNQEHLKVTDQIKIYFKDHDILSPSDYIGGNSLSKENLGEEKLLGIDIPKGKKIDYEYRAKDAKMKLDCEMLFKLTS